MTPEEDALRRALARCEKKSAGLERKLERLDVMLVANERVNQRLTDELRERKRMLDEDLQEARDFQLGLLAPLPAVEGVQLAARYLPADEVGGDLYDAFTVAPGHVRVLLGDTTGHGVQAALRTMVVRTIYERHKRSAAGPAELLALVNDEILASHQRLSVRLSAVVLDIAGGTVAYANAGQPPLLLVRDRAPVEHYEVGPFLGMVEHLAWTTSRLELAPGDRLFVYTDGLLDQWSASGERIDEARALAPLCGSGSLEEVLDAALAEAASFRGARPLADDLCVIGAAIDQPPARR